MAIDWLISTTIETSLLIGIVLICRPFVLRLFGANVSCLLWAMPLLGLILPTGITRPAMPSDLASVVMYERSLDAYSAAHVAANEVVAPLGWSLAWLWIGGMVMWIAIQLRATYRLQVSLRRSTLPALYLSHRTQQLLREAGLGMDCVYTTRHPGAPFVSGVIRAKIFLPEDFSNRFSPPELLWVLRHELAHIRRKDLLWRLLAEAFRAIFWFNPLAHLAVSVFRKDQEYACDLAVVGSCSAKQRYQYGRAMLLGSTMRHVRLPLTFFGNQKERYLMLSKHRKSMPKLLLGAGACGLLAALSLTSTSFTMAQSSPDNAYDLQSLIEVRGVVVKFMLQEQQLPRSTLYLSGVDAEGQERQWQIILSDSDVQLESRQQAQMFMLGEELIVLGHPSTDPSSAEILADSVIRLAGASSG